ncbi:MAG: hypothetical protein WC023_01440 [Rhodocyclaceae bacterium]
MSTAGEILVALSGLTGVSAGEHLLAATAGNGMIYANRFSVQIQEATTTVTRRTKVATQPAEKPATQVHRAAAPSKYVSVCTSRERIAVMTQTDCLIVTQRSAGTTVTQQFETATIIKKRN